MSSVQTPGHAIDVKHRKKAASSHQKYLANHSTTYFQGLVESISDAVVSVDKKARIVVFNAAAEKIFGYLYREVVGQPVEQLLAPGCQDHPGENIRRYLETGDISYFKRRDRKINARRKDSSIFPVFVSSDVFLNEDEPAFSIIFRTDNNSETQLPSRERFSLATEATNDGLWDWNILDNSVCYNAKWQDLIGVAPENFAGRMEPWLERLHPEEHDAFFMALMALQKGRQRTLEIEIRLQLADNSYRWFLIRGMAVTTTSGVVERIIGAASDIADCKIAEEHAKQLAFRDILTDLPNRQSLLIYLEKLLKKRRDDQSSPPFALFVIDLERFRIINESLGDSAGDNALRIISKRIKNKVRNNDFVARLSGDQFAVIASGITAARSGKIRSERLQSYIGAPLTLSAGHEVSLDANIGIRYWSGEKLTAEDILRDAILALRESKKHANIYVTEFYAELQEDLLNAVRYEADLRTAILSGKIKTYYQPIINSRTGQPSSFEALVRLWHPERGLIPPGKFVPIAEETGLIRQLANEVLRQAMHQLASWRRAFPSMAGITMAVNLSPVQFEDQNLVHDIKEILCDAGLDGTDLKIEITESLLLENSEKSTDILNQIRDLGIQICVDDFGTGYGSLSYLRNFKFDTLKIDRSFISHINEESRDVEMVKTIIQMGQNIGMNIIAEGVEKQSQAKLLKDLGCHFLQGFLLSRPLTADDAKKWIQKCFEQNRQERSLSALE